MGRDGWIKVTYDDVAASHARENQSGPAPTHGVEVLSSRTGKHNIRLPPACSPSASSPRSPTLSESSQRLFLRNMIHSPFRNDKGSNKFPSNEEDGKPLTPRPETAPRKRKAVRTQTQRGRHAPGIRIKCCVVM